VLFLCHGPGNERTGAERIDIMRKTGFTGISPKMNLQFFAESGDGAGADQGEGSGSGSETAESGTDGAETGNKEPKSFDDLLQDKNYQAEFDRRVQKALGTAKEKWEALMDDKLSEADKLAKMNKEEKAEYLRQKQEKELKDREAAITRRELMAEAKNTLAEKKLPVGLAEVLNYTDAESCNKSMATVEKAFQEAVQAAVEEKLKGGEPLKKAPSGDGKDLAKQVEDLMMGI
jgi:hypothetical protein